MAEKIPSAVQKKLLKWFERSKRPFPWRETKDPYAIWVSEVMLQQTRAVFVIPYYKKFLRAFPNLQSLSQADEESLYPLWTGLGYYQRAKNLLKASKEIMKNGGKLPVSSKELLALPGFGPYTAHAVSSLAFEEPVGVVDGNVIRFLSRFHGLPIKWWRAEGKRHFQALADRWVAGEKSSLVNQALMEIGSLICLSASPCCRLCPLAKSCVAFQAGTQNRFPLKRSKKAEEMLCWKPFVIKKENQFAFLQNRKLPFLKGRFVFPGNFKKIKKPPSDFHFQHSITHYKIYVTVQFFCLKESKKKPFKTDQGKGSSAGSLKESKKKPFKKPFKGRGFSTPLKKKESFKQMEKSFIWFDRETIKKRNPSSLIQKIIAYKIH